MVIKIKDLVNIADEKVYEVKIDSYIVENNIFLRRIDNVEGEIAFYYDASDELRINYGIVGDMICPDAITLEDVCVPFDLSLDEKVTYKIEEEGFYIPGDMEIEKMVEFIVLPEVPIKVENNEKIEYSRGDGWSFVSEEDYKLSAKDDVDPRLQKLKEYKIEEDD